MNSGERVLHALNHKEPDRVPCGGFIFATVHDIQANVPPENVMAMWEAWRDYGLYA